jgi:hypothetical protein
MSNVSVAVRGDCVGLRAAPTRKNSQVISELAGRVTRHCRALAMHGMHCCWRWQPMLRVCSRQEAAALAQHGSRGSGTLSAVLDLDSAKAFWQSLSPPVANQGHKTSPLRFSHHLLPPPGSWSFYMRANRTDDHEMLPCMSSYLMATNLHRKAIPVN